MIHFDNYWRKVKDYIFSYLAKQQVFIFILKYYFF